MDQIEAITSNSHHTSHHILSLREEPDLRPFVSSRERIIACGYEGETRMQDHMCTN